MTKKTKKRVLISFILLAVVGAGLVFFLLSKKKNIVYTTTKVQRGVIMQTVSETGTVKSENEINLSFANSGRIKNINNKVGDKVKAGQILAELDSVSLDIKKQEANAGLDVAKSSLAKLMSGATGQDVAIAKANISQAQKTYNAAVSDLEKTKRTVNETIQQAQKTVNDLVSNLSSDITPVEQAINSAQVSLSNNKKIYQKDVSDGVENALVVVSDKLTVVNNALDVFSTTVNNEDGKTLLSVRNPQYLTLAKEEYLVAVNDLNLAKISLAKAKSDRSNGNVQHAVDDAWKTVNDTNKALQDCYKALENSIISTTFTQSELDVLKNSINQEQNLMNIAVSAVQTVMQNLDNAILNYDAKISLAEDSLRQAQATYNDTVNRAKNSLSTARISGDQQINAAKSRVDSAREGQLVAQAQLNKVLAPVNSNDIDLLKAQIKQAEAGLSAINKQIDDNKIKSPIDGIITQVDYKVGEQVTLGKTAFSILGENNFKIEVLISEADISKMKLNQIAVITLDSFGENAKFNGIINFIEPAETVIQEVIYYKVIILFTDKNISYTIKSGMTANITITTDSKENVLTITNRAVIDKPTSGKFVRVLIDNEQVIEKDVEIGIKGDDGLVEILSGVAEGDNIITKIVEN